MKKKIKKKKLCDRVKAPDIMNNLNNVNNSERDILSNMLKRKKKKK